MYGVPRNERSRVLGVRVRGGGEPESRRDCLKGKVTFTLKKGELPPARKLATSLSEGGWLAYALSQVRRRTATPTAMRHRAERNINRLSKIKVARHQKRS